MAKTQQKKNMTRKASSTRRQRRCCVCRRMSNDTMRLWGNRAEVLRKVVDNINGVSRAHKQCLAKLGLLRKPRRRPNSTIEGLQERVNAKVRQMGALPNSVALIPQHCDTIWDALCVAGEIPDIHNSDVERFVRQEVLRLCTARKDGIVVPINDVIVQGPKPSETHWYACQSCDQRGIVDRPRACFSDVVAKRAFRRWNIEQTAARLDALTALDPERPPPALLYIDAWLPSLEAHGVETLFTQELLAAPALTGRIALDRLFSPNVDADVVTGLHKLGVIHAAQLCACLCPGGPRAFQKEAHRTAPAALCIHHPGSLWWLCARDAGCMGFVQAWGGTIGGAFCGTAPV